jgi:hypothetical protein
MIESGEKHCVTYPKKATEQHHPIVANQVKRIGGEPSRASVRRVRAGRIPTNPAARGIVPVATAVVWTTIISCGVRGLGNILDTRNPMRADWMDILEFSH